MVDPARSRTARGTPEAPRGRTPEAAILGRPALAALALALLASAAPAARAAWATPAFRCTLADGRVITAATDASADYPLTVTHCERAAPALAAAPPPADGRRPDTPRVRWIEAPNAGRPTPPGTPWHEAADDATAALVASACRRHGLDPALVQAVIHAESRHDPNARSPKGALGLMQVMPATGQRFGVADPALLLQPEINIEVGVRYLRELGQRFGGRLDLVVAAYNAGEASVMRHGNRVPPYPETRDYVAQVLSAYDRLRRAALH